MALFIGDRILLHRIFPAGIGALHITDVARVVFFIPDQLLIILPRLLTIKISVHIRRGNVVPVVRSIRV